MTPRPSEEQRRATHNRDCGPVEEQLRAELQVGFDQADAGDVAEWDVDEMLREAHRHYALRTSASPPEHLPPNQ